MKQIADNNDLKINIGGIDALPIFNFDNKNLEYKTLIIQEMLKKNYLVSNVIYLSILHNHQVIDKYIAELSKIFKIIKKCEQGEKIEKYLKHKVCFSPFDRLN